jgi:hypothetical protein
MKIKNAILPLIIPGVLLGSTLVQQENASLIILGQATLVTIFFLSFLMIFIYENAYLATILFSIILVLKLMRIISGDQAGIYVVIYELLYTLVFAFSGSYLLEEKYIRKTFHQSMLILISLIPFMLLQLYGQFEWVYFLRTDFHETIVSDNLSTLFVNDLEGAPTVQARPSGWLMANNYLSLYLLFCMGLLFSVGYRLRMNLSLVIVAITIVICMSKLVFIASIMLMAISFFFRDKFTKKFYIRFLTSIVIAMYMYYILFPGLFLYNVSIENAFLNVQLRYFDFINSFNQMPNENISFIGINEKQYFIESMESQSLLSSVMQSSFASAFAVIFSVFIIYILRKIKLVALCENQTYRANVYIALLLLMSVASTNFFGGPLFALMCGGFVGIIKLNLTTIDIEY